jgi:hypothetical protein
MNALSSNPEMTLLRERVNDLAAYVELWNQRAAARDRKVARTAASTAIERCNTIAHQLAGLSFRLVNELDAEIAARKAGAAGDRPEGCGGDGVCTNPRCARHGGTAWERHDDPVQS